MLGFSNFVPASVTHASQKTSEWLDTCGRLHNGRRQRLFEEVKRLSFEATRVPPLFLAVIAPDYLRHLFFKNAQPGFFDHNHFWCDCRTTLDPWDMGIVEGYT